jgi:hypothetical protein
LVGNPNLNNHAGYSDAKSALEAVTVNLFNKFKLTGDSAHYGIVCIPDNSGTMTLSWIGCESYNHNHYIGTSTVPFHKDIALLSGYSSKAEGGTDAVIVSSLAAFTMMINPDN